MTVLRSMIQYAASLFYSIHNMVIVEDPIDDEDADDF